MKMRSLLAVAVLALLPGPAAAVADPHFGARTDFPTGTNPAWAAIGDLNGDGKPDLVSANSTAHSVSVLLGDGSGSFGARTDIVTGGTPTFVAIGDLSGDGKPDLVVANGTANAVVVLLGNGNGTFGAGTSFTTGSYPQSVAIGDVNADGVPDLVVTNFYAQSVSVLLGNGNGTFRAKADFDTGYMPMSVVIGDLNGDGRRDLVVSSRGSNTVSVLLGNGSGTFGLNTDYATGDYPGFLALGDLNGDGLPDVAVANANAGTVSVLLGDGSGSLGTKTDFGTGAYPWAVAIGDLNADGTPDLAVANSAANTVSVLPGNGNGTFGPKFDFATGSTPQSVSVADLNSDGRPDVALANYGSSTVSVLLWQALASATSVVSSPNPSRAGAGVTLTATVTPATATGTVTFRDGAVSLGMATLSGGAATLLVPGLCGGSHSLTAVYAGDAGHSGSSSPGLAHVVDPAPTSVAVLSSLNPSRPGEAVSFTASVTDSAAGSCALTGTVQFVVDGVSLGGPVALSGGAATSNSITTLALGPHSVHAVYSGNASYQASTSPAITQSVALAVSGTTLGSGPNPSHAGEVVTLTAVVTPPGATGTVTFRDGADSLGSATVRSGVATMTTAALAVGDHPLTAAYGGDGAFASSVSPVALHTVLPVAPTTLVLSSSPAPSVVGQAVLLTATITPAGASGSVEFRSDGTPIGTGILAGGVATLSVPGMCGGSYSLTAVYAGDPDHHGSSSPALVHVVSPAPTTVTVVSSPNPSHPGEAVGFTASVSGTAAGSCALTGTVQFVVDGLPLGAPVGLSGGLGTLGNVTSLATGLHGVHAVYSGNASHQGSTSAVITHSVVANPSATSLGSSPNPSHVGDLVTLTAVVTPPGATGTVTFRDGTDSLGAATLGSGVATMTTAALAVGDHPLTAAYPGDGVYAASVSPIALHTTLPIETTALALSSSPAPSVVGQAVVLTATLSPAGASGSIEFRDGANPLGSASLAGGVAILQLPGLCGGTHTLTAVYAGVPGYSGSTSPGLEHSVNPAPTSVTLASSLNPARLAQAVDFTASVSGPAAGSCPLAGTVAFVIDGVPYGAPVALSGGAATLGNVTTLASGSHGVQAIYSGNASYQGSTSPAITQEIEAPRPGIAGVRDVVNDQGGRVKLMWNASYLDLAPYNRIESYWVLRSAPPAVAARAIAAGARVSQPGAAPEPGPGSFLAVRKSGATYFWEYLATQPAFHVPNYSYVAATTLDSVAGSNPLTAFLILARTAGGAEYWYSDPDSGYSVDNLAPLAPAQFTGTYSSGVARLHWARNAEADLGQYRLHRATSSDFAPGPGNLVVAQPDTGYTDAAGALYHYKLCAVDVHGNTSAYTALLPVQTVGVGDGAAPAFALGGVRPNPSRGGPLSVSFTLPTSAYARIELVDVGGRRVAGREVGTLGAGRHSVTLAPDGRLAPGLYLLRLTQGTNVRVARVAVLK